MSKVLRSSIQPKNYFKDASFQKFVKPNPADDDILDRGAKEFQSVLKIAQAIIKEGTIEDCISQLFQIDDDSQKNDPYWPYPWIVQKVRENEEFRNAVAKRAINNPEMKRLLEIAQRG